MCSIPDPAVGLAVRPAPVVARAERAGADDERGARRRADHARTCSPTRRCGPDWPRISGGSRRWAGMTSLGHPARQVLIGVLVPVLFVLLLAVPGPQVVAVRAGAAAVPRRHRARPQEDQRVRPPRRAGPPQVLGRRGQRPAAHRGALAAAAGFLAVVLAVTAKMLAAVRVAAVPAPCGGSPSGRAGSRSAGRSSTWSWTPSTSWATTLRRSPAGPAACWRPSRWSVPGVFAWLQPAARPGRRPSCPGWRA